MDNLKVSLSTEPPQNLEELVDYVKELETDVDFLHFDIMDGVFVEKKNYDSRDVKFIRSLTTIPFDVHLMTVKPETKLEFYAKCGINILTVHFEAFNSYASIQKMLKKIRQNSMLAGISIKPETDVEKIAGLLPLVDLVLVMSVEPGKSGQEFMDQAYDKVKKLSEYKLSHNFLIEVDGGVAPDIAKKLASLGADMVVSGNFVYCSKNRKKSIELLRDTK